MKYFITGLIALFSITSFAKGKTIEVLATCDTNTINSKMIKNYLNIMVDDNMVTLKSKKVKKRPGKRHLQTKVHKLKFKNKKLSKFLKSERITLGEFSHEFSAAFDGKCDLLIPSHFGRRKTKRPARIKFSQTNENFFKDLL